MCTQLPSSGTGRRLDSSGTRLAADWTTTTFQQPATKTESSAPKQPSNSPTYRCDSVGAACLGGVWVIWSRSPRHLLQTARPRHLPVPQIPFSYPSRKYLSPIRATNTFLLSEPQIPFSYPSRKYPNHKLALKLLSDYVAHLRRHRPQHSFLSVGYSELQIFFRSLTSGDIDRSKPKGVAQVLLHPPARRPSDLNTGHC